MKRSAHVTAPLLAATAFALLTACKQKEMQRCVDENGVVVDNSLCGLPQQPVSNQSGYIPHIYRYYYGGWGNYDLGTHVGGGSYVPLGGHSYGTVSRGGFGSSFGHGGGE